jgi:hypothetical protein
VLGIVITMFLENHGNVDLGSMSGSGPSISGPRAGVLRRSQDTEERVASSVLENSAQSRLSHWSVWLGVLVGGLHTSHLLPAVIYTRARRFSVKVRPWSRSEW